MSGTPDNNYLRFEKFKVLIYFLNVYNFYCLNINEKCLVWMSTTFITPNQSLALISNDIDFYRLSLLYMDTSVRVIKFSIKTLV